MYLLRWSARGCLTGTFLFTRFSLILLKGFGLASCSPQFGPPIFRDSDTFMSLRLSSISPAQTEMISHEEKDYLLKTYVIWKTAELLTDSWSGIDSSSSSCPNPRPPWWQLKIIFNILLTHRTGCHCWRCKLWAKQNYLLYFWN